MQTAQRIWQWISGLRIAGPLVFFLWLYLAWKVWVGGYFQDAFSKGVGYMREVNVSC